jgi:hypothetical protein
MTELFKKDHTGLKLLLSKNAPVEDVLSVFTDVNEAKSGMQNAALTARPCRSRESDCNPQDDQTQPDMFPLCAMVSRVGGLTDPS